MGGEVYYGEQALEKLVKVFPEFTRAQIEQVCYNYMCFNVKTAHKVHRNDPSTWTGTMNNEQIQRLRRLHDTNQAPCPCCMSVLPRLVYTTRACDDCASFFDGQWERNHLGRLERH